MFQRCWSPGVTARCREVPRDASVVPKWTQFVDIAPSASLQGPSMHIARKDGKDGGFKHVLFSISYMG